MLVDTSVLIAAERGRRDLRRLPSSRELAVSVVSIGEYWRGVERAKSAALRDRRRRFYAEIEARFDIVDLSLDAALTSARVWADLERRGRRVPSLDLLIAATAIARDWPLATADVKDFRRVEGLELVELPHD